MKLMQDVDANYMSRYAVVAGHTSHSYVESYYPMSTETAAFTFVREPVARWISGVWYYRKEQKMPILSREDALDVLVKTIEGTGKDTKNAYSKYLLTTAEQQSDMSKEEDAAVIVERLGQLDFVGVVERWEESLAMLGELLGSSENSETSMILQKYTNGRKNKNKGREEGGLSTSEWVEELKSKRPEAYDKLRQYLRYEQMIYDEGVRLFNLEQVRE